MNRFISSQIIIKWKAVSNLRKPDETKLREEYARQVLLAMFPEKYQDSSLGDQPDIQNEQKDIGVEVTGTLEQRVRYGVAQFSTLYNKHISSVTSKKKEQLKKHLVRLVTDDEGTIKFIIPEAVWGSGNKTKEAFSNKLNKLNDGNYKTFDENNLFLFAEDEEEYEVRSLIEHIKATEMNSRKFNLIYLYTYQELYVISTQDYSFEVLTVREDQKEVFLSESIKIATT